MNNRSRAAKAALVTLAVAVATLVAPATANASESDASEYTVLAADNVSAAAAIAAIERAGGTVVSRNDTVGMFGVVAGSGFAVKAAGAKELTGAAPRAPIGRAPADKPAADQLAERAKQTATVRKSGSAAGMDPLDDKLWGLQMVRADEARKVEAGDKKVMVGILDTGVDASHPDIAPNFSTSLSRNFAKDLPDVDGPCEVTSCLDPVGTDDGGHGTHVAGTIGAAANGFGVSGIAPGVTLVELKGGQDSGYFFLEPVVNALTYAGDAGLDVVNMSFYVDPWLYNCTANSADSPAQQAEQRTIIAAMNRALNYAYRKGVTLIAALGNEHTDLGKPGVDATSPDYGAPAYARTIDNSTCLNLPAEGPHVIGVSALGPSGRKSDYSNYGLEQISVAAPGGWFRDGLGTDTYRTDGNEILSTYPKKVLQEEGFVDEAGEIVPGAETFVFKECTPKGVCGYYTYLQGTSMASPHAAGVAALIVSRFGYADPSHRGTKRLEPFLTEALLVGTAAAHACPEPQLQSYVDVGRSADFDALCEGNTAFNGFYGHGIVDAYAAVTARF